MFVTHLHRHLLRLMKLQFSPRYIRRVFRLAGRISVLSESGMAPTYKGTSQGVSPSSSFFVSIVQTTAMGVISKKKRPHAPHHTWTRLRSTVPIASGTHAPSAAKAPSSTIGKTTYVVTTMGSDESDALISCTAYPTMAACRARTAMWAKFQIHSFHSIPGETSMVSQPLEVSSMIVKQHEAA